MSALDDAVGRVLAKVREMGQEEQTLIVFTSDNGGPTPSTTSNNGPLHGFKAQTWEGGVRVPFCMQWKGKLPAGRTFDHPIIQLDILPTALAAAGVASDPSWKLDGVNLLPYLTGEKSGRRIRRSTGDSGSSGRSGTATGSSSSPAAAAASPSSTTWPRISASSPTWPPSNPEKVRELQALWDRWNAEQEPSLVPDAPNRNAAEKAAKKAARKAAAKKAA